MRMRFRSTLVLAVVALGPVASRALFVPVGSEFQVNTTTTADQVAVRTVRSAANGDFVVAWAGGRSTPDMPRAQRFASDGSAVGSEFVVSAAPAVYAALAVQPAGEFIIVWDGADDGDLGGIGGLRFASNGTPIGTEFVANTYTTAAQEFGGVALQSNGDFMVTWASNTQDGTAHGIFAQRFASDGSATGTEFAVNSYTGGNELYPSIAALSNDGFVVVWQGSHDGDSSGVFASRFSSTGAAVGTEFQVNTYTSAEQILPAVTGGITGDFTVVWASGSGFIGSDNDVFAQRYASDGSPLGAEFLVNAFTPGSQRVADVDVHPNGDFVIVYDAGSFMGGYHQDGSYQGLFGRHFASNGTAVGAEFQVNTYTTGFQLVPSVASQGNGAFVVVWNSNAQDADGVGVFAQRFREATPTPTPVGAVCAATPIGGCATPLKAGLKIKGGDPARHRLIWKWLKGTATKSDFGNPATGSTEHRLCVYDDGALVMSPLVQADGNWSDLTKGYKYSNTVGNADGLTKAILKEGAGTAKILFKGKGAALPAPLPLAQSTAVTVQLVKNLGSGAECWESVFAPPAVTSDAAQFKDKLP